MGQVLEITDDSFDQEVLQSDVPVLVDFFGDHCSACVQIAPLLDALAEERAGTAKIVKIHAADNYRSSGQYGVRAMPTVLAFFEGTVRGQLVGARPKAAFAELLDSAR